MLLWGCINVSVPPVPYLPACALKKSSVQGMTSCCWMIRYRQSTLRAASTSSPRHALMPCLDLEYGCAGRSAAALGLNLACLQHDSAMPGQLMHSAAAEARRGHAGYHRSAGGHHTAAGHSPAAVPAPGATHPCLTGGSSWCAASWTLLHFAAQGVKHLTHTAMAHSSQCPCVQADLVIVMEAGRITAQGTYEELVAQGINFHAFQDRTAAVQASGSSQTAGAPCSAASSGWPAMGHKQCA